MKEELASEAERRFQQLGSSVAGHRLCLLGKQGPGGLPVVLGLTSPPRMPGLGARQHVPPQAALCMIVRGSGGTKG